MPVLVEIRDQLPSLLGGFVVALAVSLVVLPVILYDLARMSNRFAGPMLCLRRGMEQVVAGERVEAIHFRDDDYWQEFADAFNVLNERLQSQEQAIRQTESEPAEKLVSAR